MSAATSNPVLARIRDALRGRPAPHPVHHGSGDGPSPGHHRGAVGDHGDTTRAAARTEDASHRTGVEERRAPNPEEFRAWLPLVGPTRDERLALFAVNAANLKADFHVLTGDAELPAHLAGLAAREGWQRLGTHRGALTDLAVSGLPPALAGNVLRVDDAPAGFAIPELERCDAGISECEALVAQTGSVLVSARASGGRALSVLPPHHVVVARAAQLVPDLPAAFDVLQSRYGAGDDYPSFIGFITGPSRTGDIERILVLGAHGPKKLTIFCLP